MSIIESTAKVGVLFNFIVHSEKSNATLFSTGNEGAPSSPSLFNVEDVDKVDTVDTEDTEDDEEDANPKKGSPGANGEDRVDRADGADGVVIVTSGVSMIFFVKAEALRLLRIIVKLLFMLVATIFRSGRVTKWTSVLNSFWYCAFHERLNNLSSQKSAWLGRNGRRTSNGFLGSFGTTHILTKIDQTNK
jgi:hypothetical protein